MNYFNLFMFIAKTIGIIVIITNTILFIINSYSQINKLLRNNTNICQDNTIDENIIIESNSDNEEKTSSLS